MPLSPKRSLAPFTLALMLAALMPVASVRAGTAAANRAPVLEERFDRPAAEAPDASSPDAGISDATLPAGWKPVVFGKIERHTVYGLVKHQGRPALQAHADRAASGLVWEREFDPAAAPVLAWCWAVSGVLPRGDITRKAGDDLPARLLVLFPYDPEQASFATRVAYGFYRAIYGEYPPGKALSYVWANRLPEDEIVPSAYTGRVRHIAVESGPGRAGEWVAERRDIVADFRRAFPGDPLPQRARIGIMVDTDNTGAVTTSWFTALSIAPAAE